MKVVILAGGKGTRLGEETHLRPKPMVEIGGKPILWHIQRWYALFGYNEFIICCGYKGQMIKDFYIHYPIANTDYEVDFANDSKRQVSILRDDWKVTLANTGLETLTAGRILRIKDYIGDDEEFMLTYGDGVSDVNIRELVDFHHQSGKIVTISTTKPDGRFGALSFDEKTGTVAGFKEKSRDDQSWVNIGFMVMNRKVFDYLGDGSEMLEASPFEKLAFDGEMAAYKHMGFWSPMDNIHDREYLEKLWNTGKAPWRV